MLAAERFRRLLSDLALTGADRASGLRAHRAVRGVLQAHYYGHLTIHDHSRLVGAWAKGTEVRPPRSIDLLFTLPKALRDRDWRALGGSSPQLQILHDVKQVLEAAGMPARIRADRCAIATAAGDEAVDVRPVFATPGGAFLACDPAGDGRFRTIDPGREEANLRQADQRTHGNARDLIRMMKCWQAHRAVPLPSFAIELLALEFLAAWPRAGDETSFYDWMVRDFFAFIAGRAGLDLDVPGGEDRLVLGGAWVSAARAAQAQAAKACESETAGLDADAWWAWEKIFGERIPLDA